MLATIPLYRDVMAFRIVTDKIEYRWKLGEKPIIFVTPWSAEQNFAPGTFFRKIDNSIPPFQLPAEHPLLLFRKNELQPHRTIIEGKGPLKSFFSSFIDQPLAEVESEYDTFRYYYIERKGETVEMLWRRGLGWQCRVTGDYRVKNFKRVNEKHKVECEVWTPTNSFTMKRYTEMSDDEFNTAKNNLC